MLLVLEFLYKSSIAIWNIAPGTLYSMTAKLGVIKICDLVKLILCIVKVNFTKNTRITFSTIIKNMTCNRFHCLNSIHTGI